MIINGKVNGVELPVEVDNEVINQIRSDAVDSFIRNLITVKANYIAENCERLTEDEFEQLVETVKERSSDVWDYLADSILSGQFAKLVEDLYYEALDSRVKYYKVEGEVIIPFVVVVKAHDEDEATQFVKDMAPDDLETNDDLKWYDGYTDIGYSADVTDEGYCDDDPRIYDATE